MPRKVRTPRAPDQATLAFLSALGQRIRNLRDAEYNQDDFAAKVDVYRSHMSRIEQGKTDLRASTLLRIAAALGMSVSELLDLPEGRPYLKTEE